MCVCVCVCVCECELCASVFFSSDSGVFTQHRMQGVFYSMGQDTGPVYYSAKMAHTTPASDVILQPS